MITRSNSIFQNKWIVIVLTLLISNWSASQDISARFQSINDSDSSTAEKEKLFDNLLLDHYKKNNVSQLLSDRYELQRWYYRQGNIEKALAHNRRNLFLIDSLKMGDSAVYRKNRYSFGFYLLRNNQKKEAADIFNTLVHSETIDAQTFKSYSSLAQMSYNEEDFYAAADLYERGLELAINEKNSPYVAAFSQGAGYAYKVIKTEKSLSRGITVTKEALELLEQKKNPTPLDKLFLYNLYDLLGNLYNDRQDYNFDTSLTNYLKAERIAKKLNDSMRLSTVYNNLGYLYLHDNHKEANLYFDKALTFKPDKSLSSQLYKNKAEYYSKNNDKEAALNYIQKSIESLTKVDPSQLESLPEIDAFKDQEHKYLLLSSLIYKAKIWIEFSHQNPISGEDSYKNALQTLRLADTFVDIIRLVTTENKSKLYWRETASDIYVNATKVCFELNLPEEAFYFIEKNKALLLLEDLNKKQLIKNSNIPKTITDRETQLKANIVKYSTTESDNTNMYNAKVNYRQFLDSLDNNFRLYFKVQQPADVIDLHTLQSELEPDNAFLEFILDDNNGYGLLITQNQIELYNIDRCDLLKQNILQYRQLLSHPQRTLSDQNAYFKVSNHIYQALFPDRIQELIQNKSLTIVPDYYLQSIPFEALQTEDKAHRYMIFEHQIDYAYSATLLHNNKRIQRTNENQLIAFAPVHFKDLPNLTNTKSEAEHIGNILTSHLYLEKEATTSNFTNNIHDHNIIHIASHANSGTTEDIDPWIEFYDKRLNLQEIYQLDLEAELVVLSACETSLGENYKGEGAMSLTRGFFNSGANSVISTLWNINDKSSTEIIADFYNNLNNGLDKSSALHSAKLRYIASSELSEKSPYYWASFVLTGDTSAIMIEGNTHHFFLFIFGSIALLLLGYVVLRKKS